MAADLQPVSDKLKVPGETRRAAGGFTLVEMLVSTAIMLIVMLVLLQVVAGMTNIWHNTSGEISSFQSARAAFNTITRTLSRATLKTYIDYYNSTTKTVVTSSALGTVNSFIRSSDLWFASGPTVSFSSAPPLGNAANFPGDAVFFNAPLGIASNPNAASNYNYKFLQRSLNFVGFYVSYCQTSTASGTAALPPWLQTALGFTAANPYRFRLMEYMENADQMSTYKLISSTSPTIAYGLAMTSPFAAAIQGTSIKYGAVTSAGQNVELADNIVLLIFRPRVEPADESILATSLGVSPYNATTANSIISPNYGYDSRAWWSSGTTSNYTGTTQGKNRTVSAAYAGKSRNQLPPIMDVAMVAVDPNSIIRLGTASTTPPTSLVVSTALFGLSGTCNPSSSPASANMDADLATFGAQLATNHIHYRIFRTSVQMEDASWVDN